MKSRCLARKSTALLMAFLIITSVFAIPSGFLSTATPETEDDLDTIAYSNDFDGSNPLKGIALSGAGIKYEGYIDASSSGADHRLTVEYDAGKNYTLEADLKISSFGSAANSHLSIRLLDGVNLILGKGISGIRFTNPASDDLINTSKGFSAVGDWVSLSVTVLGSNVSVSVNGNPFGSWNDSRIGSANTAKIAFAHNGAPFMLDNLHISSLGETVFSQSYNDKRGLTLSENLPVDNIVILSVTLKGITGSNEGEMSYGLRIKTRNNLTINLNRGNIGIVPNNSYDYFDWNKNSFNQYIGQTVELRIETIGDTVKIYVNGVLLHSASAAAFAECPAGPLEISDWECNYGINSVTVIEPAEAKGLLFYQLYNDKKDLTLTETLPKDNIITLSINVKSFIGTDLAEGLRIASRSGMTVNICNGNAGVVLRKPDDSGDDYSLYDWSTKDYLLGKYIGQTIEIRVETIGDTVKAFINGSLVLETTSPLIGACAPGPLKVTNWNFSYGINMVKITEPGAPETEYSNQFNSDVELTMVTMSSGITVQKNHYLQYTCGSDWTVFPGTYKDFVATGRFRFENVYLTDKNNAGDAHIIFGNHRLRLTSSWKVAIDRLNSDGSWTEDLAKQEPVSIPVGAWIDFKILQIGSKINVVVGSYKLTVEGAQTQEGFLGLGGWNTQFDVDDLVVKTEYFEPPAPPATGTVLLEDHFDGTEINTELWSQRGTPPLKIMPDPLDPDNKVLAHPPEDSKQGEYPYLDTVKNDFTDFTITARLMMPTSGNGNVGFNLRAIGTNTFVRAEFSNDWEGRLVWSGDDAQYTPDMRIEPDVWHNIRIIADGNQYEVYVNGKKVCSLVDDHLTEGGISIGGWNSPYYIDDVVVYMGRVDEQVIEPEGGRTFYVDANASPGGDGRSPETAWRTIQQVNNFPEFYPGDKILFKAGCVWEGTTLSPSGNGSPQKPIVISSYGEGPKPVIDRKGPGPNQPTTTLVLTNQSYWTIENITLSNSNPNGKGTLNDPVDDGNGHILCDTRQALLINAKYVNGQSQFVVRGITIRNVDIVDVDSTDGDEGNGIKERIKGKIGWGTWGGGINLSGSQSTDGQYRAWLEDILIENCRFYNVGGTAITSSFGLETYHKNVTIRNNIVDCDENFPQSNHGFYLVCVQNCLIEYNTLRNLTNGLAFQYARNSTMQYNVVINSDGYLHTLSKLTGKDERWDGCGIDADTNCSGTITFRGNYTYNCYAGAYAFFDYTDVENVPEATIVLENNISHNDRTFIYYQVDHAAYTFKVRNNTVYRDANAPYADENIIRLYNSHNPSALNKLVQDQLTITANIFDYPEQTMRLNRTWGVYEGNAYFADSVMGSVGDVKELKDPLLKIPDDATARRFSFCGNAPNTISLVDSGYYVPQPGSYCLDSNGKPVCGVDFAALKLAADQFWGRTNPPEDEGSNPSKDEGSNPKTGLTFVSGIAVMLLMAAGIAVVLSNGKRFTDNA